MNAMRDIVPEVARGVVLADSEAFDVPMRYRWVMVDVDHAVARPSESVKSLNLHVCIGTATCMQVSRLQFDARVYSHMCS